MRLMAAGQRSAPCAYPAAVGMPNAGRPVAVESPAEVGDPTEAKPENGGR
jgi:hypothetical protein